MSDVENLLNNDEELPMEDKKKAINLQDLVYVKRYINEHHNGLKEELNSKCDNFIEEVRTEKETLSENFRELSTRLDDDYQDVKNRLETGMEAFVDSKIGEHIDSVVNGLTDGTITAANANKIQNVDLSADDTAQFGEYVVSKKKHITACDIPFIIDPDYNLFYVDMYSLSNDFARLMKGGRTYELVIRQGGSAPIDHHCRVHMVETPSGTEHKIIRSYRSDIFRMYGIKTLKGDIALFTLDFYFKLGANDETTYLPNASLFELQLIQGATDKIEPQTITPYTFTITAIYEIVE